MSVEYKACRFFGKNSFSVTKENGSTLLADAGLAETNLGQPLRGGTIPEEMIELEISDKWWWINMSPKKFLQDDRGFLSTEYVIFVAAIGTLLVIGIGVLFMAMGEFFSSWATYFGK